MPTNRNPSLALSDAQVDDIVDRLLRGRYEKHRPVQAVEVVRAGLMGQQACRADATTAGVPPGLRAEAAALLLIDGAPRWVWMVAKDIELLDGAPQ